jgi:hypothetical protein
MLWLVGYYDACGHPDGKHALAVGGYVSAVPAWLRFEKRWKRALKEAGITIPFHMTDFMACQRGFEDWKGREDEQGRLLLKLAGITKENVRRGFSTMIRLEAWNRVNSESYTLKESRCTPYAICAFFTMDKTFRWLRRRTRRFAVRFIFEDGDKHKGDFIWMMDQFIGKDTRLLGGVKPSFESKDLAPLQACDFVMWEQFNVAKDRIKNPAAPAPLRDSFNALYSIPSEWGVIDYEKLIKFCDDFDVPKRGEAPRPWSPFRDVRLPRGGARQ